jgi:hypothetical protein
MSFKKHAFIVFFLCICQFAFAQKVVYLTKGFLLDGANRYGRKRFIQIHSLTNCICTP